MPIASVQLRLSEVIAALSSALDLTEGQSIGHSARSCLIGMRLAERLDLPPDQRHALFYALLLKDAGCSSNAGRLASLFQADDQTLKREHKLIDWTRTLPAFRYAMRLAAPDGTLFDRVRRILEIALRKEEVGRGMMEIRCDRGAEIIRMLGLPEATVEAVRNLDEHWDGKGHPKGLAEHQIPLLGRILCLAQTADVFYCAYGLEAMTTMLANRRSRWFDPDLVFQLTEFLGDREFWDGLRTDNPALLTAAHEPPDRILEATEDRLDSVTRAFARVIDAKSPWTARHSERVALLCQTMARILGLAPDEERDLIRAAMLHEIGMLGVSSLIVEKPGALTADQREALERHPAFSYEILRRVAVFERVAEIAAAHHEHLDGTGYPRGLVARQIDLPARILAVATRAEALLADRPQRRGLTWDAMLQELAPLVGRKLDERCYRTLVEMTPR
ncbi:MAG TPA: HD domain-containing phosphohydrolase [Gemmatimonadales bacterium]|nr:HD domain-containing phosphohydrolase [Gemmatimonadales bacterium]